MAAPRKNKSRRGSGARMLTEGTWNPPPGEGEETVWTDFPGDRGTTRITVKVRRLEHRLIDFAMMHDVFVGGEWRNVTRVDCSNHSSVHQHVFTRSGGERAPYKVLAPLHSADDVVAAYDLAYDLVYDGIHRHERQWHGQARP